MSIAAIVLKYTPLPLITYPGAGKLAGVDKTTDLPPPDPGLPDVLWGGVFADEAEEMLPGYGPVEEEGSTWEAYQDDGTFPPWL